MENAPIREIKSVAVPAQFFILGPFYAFLVAALLFSVLMGAAAQSPSLLRDIGRAGPFAFFIICGIVGSGILTICMVWSGIKAFKRTTYTIYPDRVEYSEGIWNRQWHIVAFDEVLDVGLTEGALHASREPVRSCSPSTPRNFSGTCTWSCAEAKSNSTTSHSPRRFGN